MAADVPDGASPHMQCALLALSPELRNLIYDYVFTVTTSDGKVTMRHNDNIRSTESSVLAFLQTCRLVNDEAAAIFYHNNHLNFCPEWPSSA